MFVEITLSGQADEVLDAFEKAVAKVPDVLECHLMAGAADYLIKIMAEDTEDFARIHRRYLARLPGVRAAFSAARFHEAVLLLERPVAPLLEELAARGIEGGLDLAPWYPELGPALLVCATETRTQADISAYAAALSAALASERAA